MVGGGTMKENFLETKVHQFSLEINLRAMTSTKSAVN